jgi:hypothetical protein
MAGLGVAILTGAVAGLLPPSTPPGCPPPRLKRWQWRGLGGWARTTAVRHGPRWGRGHPGTLRRREAVRFPLRSAPARLAWLERVIDR